MIAMQYTFVFPDEYDMGSIRTRVAERGHLFDELDGLYEKAFLISEKGVLGASQNSYAPLYLWNYNEAATNFLAGEKFRAVSNDFGRPIVQSWMPLYFSGRNAKQGTPVCATTETIKVGPDTDLEEMRRTEYKVHRHLAEHADCHSSFIGLDPASWQIARFALWTKPPGSLSKSEKTFEVAYLAISQSEGIDSC